MSASASPAVGDALPAGRLVPDERDLFLFSAATQNPHRIHYDLTWTRDVEGLPGLVVHGPLIAAGLARVITDWLGADGMMRAFAVRQRGTAHLGDVVALGATVTARRDSPAGTEFDLEHEARVGDRVIASGTATVEVTRAAGPAPAR